MVEAMGELQDRAEGERSVLGEADTGRAEEWSTDGLMLPKPQLEGWIDELQAARVYDALFKRTSAPRQLGRYVVLDSLGQGGTGVVLRAYDRELDRTVALKVLHRGLDERCTQRLRREAQAMAKLSHPNVVQVYEVGEVEDQTFVAMELCKGKTLHEWMQQRPRPSWQACVELFVQLGAGLAAAHERGLVHRDFKPGNAIVDAKGRARVLDFGLARRDLEVGDDPSTGLEKVRTEFRAARPLEASLTASGVVMGTPAYMAPEQVAGLEADARSDQFSFCVSLFEAVYGERPYAGGSLLAISASMRARAVRLAPKGREVPMALRRALLRGLSLRPDERWPSMEVLLEELRRLIAPRRRRWMALAVSVGLVAVGGGMGAMQSVAQATTSLSQPERCRDLEASQAEVPPPEDRAAAERAAALGDELAETRFELARALWTAPAAEGRDRPRARMLAEQARDAYAAAGEAREAERAEVEGWLRRAGAGAE